MSTGKGPSPPLLMKRRKSDWKTEDAEVVSVVYGYNLSIGFLHQNNEVS